MRETTDPRYDAGQDRITRREQSWFVSRPDRVALWAFLLTLVITLFAAVSGAGAATSGGVGSGGTSSGDTGNSGDPQTGEPSTTGPPIGPIGVEDSEGLPAPCQPAEFGDRILKHGDCGADVKTLNWILRASADAGGLGLGPRFGDPTEDAVQDIQREGDLRTDGVVDGDTRGVLKRTMPKAVATWYGPTLYGNRTACGQRLRPTTLGVAHRTLPCGTKVTIAYDGEFVRTRVIDRGPYANGADWDLTEALAEAIGFGSEGVAKIRFAAIR